jgi:CBS domain-containing protein
MRAHQIMTKPVITVTPETTIFEAANVMLRNHVSGLPVVDTSGKLVGIVPEGDFLRRSEIGTERRRRRWLSSVLPGSAARDFVAEHGRRISQVMTPDPVTVTEDVPLADVVDRMEAQGVKRLPVMRGERLVGIVTRANVLQAAASLGRHVSDPTADDDHIRNRIFHAMEKQDWCPLGLSVIVRDGIVHLSGILIDEQGRQATIIAAENVEGVVKVHDHLRWLEPISGLSIASPEDEEYAGAGLPAELPQHALPFH